MPDRLALVLCGVGAVLLGWSGGSALDAILLSAGFYGVHRITQSPTALAFVGAPVLAWTLRQASVFTPEHVAGSDIATKASSWLAGLVMSVAIAGSIVLAQKLVGRALAIVTVIAIGVAFFARTAALLPFDARSTPFLLIEATARGWSSVGRLLASICWLVLGIGGAPPPGLPRAGGAITGAIGAALFVALLHGLPDDVASENDGASIVGVLLVAVAWVLFAIGMGAIARVGVKGGWAGLGLAILQILTIPVAVAAFDARRLSVIIAMSVPFALTGLAITALSARTLPWRPIHLIVGSAAITCVTASLASWLFTALEALRVVRVREPWFLVKPFAMPAATIALVAWAAYLLYVAAPPAHAAQPYERG